jgi:DNA polymerase-3 subunit alpha
MFSEQIDALGDILQVGKSVIIEVEASQRGEGTSLRLLGARPIAQEVEKTGRHLVIFANDKKCLLPIKSQLKLGGEGEVRLVVIRDSGAREYEVALRGNYRLTHELAGAIKSLEGVVDVRLN